MRFTVFTLCALTAAAFAPQSVAPTPRGVAGLVGDPPSRSRSSAVAAGSTTAFSQWCRSPFEAGAVSDLRQSRARL